MVQWKQKSMGMLLGLLCGGWAMPTLAGEGVELKVMFETVEPLEGQVLCSLYAEPSGFPGTTEKAIQAVAVTVTAVPVVCNFGKVKPGRYAVSAMHDENSNGRLDTNLVGIPKEGWAVSNNAPPRMFGAPSFEQAAFDLTEEGEATVLQLQFRY